MAELTQRYIVMSMATEGPFDVRDPEAVFVLKPWKDPVALLALQAYRAHCYPELGAELDAWIRLIEAGPAVRGGVGARNEQHLTTGAKALRKPAPRRRARPKAKLKVAERKPVKKRARRKRR